MNSKRHVQITEDLFLDLVQFFCLGEFSDGDQSYSRVNAIREELEKKLEKMVRRELYSSYKKAESREEKAKLLAKYVSHVTEQPR